MKVLLTLASSSKVKAGVEIFNDHLKKVFPDLKILDYDSIREKFAEPVSVFKEPIYAKRLCKWFMDSGFKTDAVFTNGMYGWALDKNILKCPIINIQHGTYAAFAHFARKKKSLDYWRIRYIYSYFEKLSAKNADLVIANSEFTKENLKKYYNVESISINNAVDTSLVRPAKKNLARKKLGLPANKKIGIFVGRPDYTKGWDIFLNIVEKFPGIFFIAILFPKIESQLKNLKIFSNVKYSDLKHYYSSADFCVFPSRFEGFGYSPLEALACNIPVVANTTGVLKYFGISGLYKTQNREEEYAENIKKGMPKTATHGFISKRFGFEKFKESYLAALNQISKGYIRK